MMILTPLQISGLLFMGLSVAMFVVMHGSRTQTEYFCFLYLATILGIIATTIGILT